MPIRRINNMLLKNCTMDDNKPGICYCAPLCKHVLKADDEHFIVPVCIYMGDSAKDEDIQEDEYVYGVPSSAAEARDLADLYQEAEDILAAYRAGEYVPPPPLPYYRDNKPKDRSMWGMKMAALMAGVARDLNRTTFLDGQAP